ncbi:MAG TPA: preprotein translocase subunit SecA [Planctomycetota bacterium]|nr:preprotein translocase subunit SecA [Planctomycetota bacterium]
MAQQRTQATDGDGGDGLWGRLREKLVDFLDVAPTAIARAVNHALKFLMRGSRIQRTFRELQPFVEEINRLEADMLRLDDDALRGKTEEFRLRLRLGKALGELEARDIPDWPGLCARLRKDGAAPAPEEAADAPKPRRSGKQIWDLVPADLRAALAGDAPREHAARLVSELNELARTHDFFRDADMATFTFTPAEGDPLAFGRHAVCQEHMQRLNRLLLRDYLAQGKTRGQGETLDALMPEAFAVAREAADRRIGMCSVFYRAFGFKTKREGEDRWDPKHLELFDEGLARVDAAAEAGGLPRLDSKADDDLGDLTAELVRLEEEADRAADAADTAKARRRAAARLDLEQVENEADSARHRATTARQNLDPPAAELARVADGDAHARQGFADALRRQGDVAGDRDLLAARAEAAREEAANAREFLRRTKDPERKVTAEDELKRLEAGREAARQALFDAQACGQVLAELKPLLAALPGFGVVGEAVKRREAAAARVADLEDRAAKAREAGDDATSIEREAAYARAQRELLGKAVPLLSHVRAQPQALEEAERLQALADSLPDVERRAREAETAAAQRRKRDDTRGPDPEFEQAEKELTQARAARDVVANLAPLVDAARRHPHGAEEAGELGRLADDLAHLLAEAEGALTAAQAEADRAPQRRAEEAGDHGRGKGAPRKGDEDPVEAAAQRVAEARARRDSLAELAPLAADAARASRSLEETRTRLAAGAGGAAALAALEELHRLEIEAERARQAAEVARAMLDDERAPEVEKARRARQKADAKRREFHELAAQRVGRKAARGRDARLVQAEQDMRRLDKVAADTRKSADEARSRPGADPAEFEALDAEALRAHREAQRARREFSAALSRLQAAAAASADVMSTAMRAQQLDNEADRAEAELDAARERPDAAPEELEELQAAANRARLRSVDARQLANAALRPRLAKVGGPEIARLMFPASFYNEIRDRCPDCRPPFRMRPFDVQLVGGIVLHQGKIAEMVTGEGKTLVATLPAYLNALGGTHIHIVTVNDYLAERDRYWNGPMFEALGVSVGLILTAMESVERQPEYAASITYGTNNEFGFDYLRDNMKDNAETQVQGPLDFAIVDEVDNILVDEARTPLIISGPAEGSIERYEVSHRLVSRLTGFDAQRLPRGEPEQREEFLRNYDYTFNRKDHSVGLTERGIKNAQRFLGVESLYHGRNADWPPYIEAALKAKELYKRDVEYAVMDGEVIIIDEFTGRLMPGRRWSDGLHQAVEAKEAARDRTVRVREENQTLATITLQNYFRLYKKIAGMTGTALSEAGEFMKIYKLDVMRIRTNRPLRRTACHDLVYGLEDEKWAAVVDEIALVSRIGRPILVGTISVEKSEKLGALLERRGIKHEVLNAKNHEKEAGIVAMAGCFGAVTVATNMAGRGTDIVLGPCSPAEVLARWQEHDLAPRDLPPELTLSPGLDPHEFQRRREAIQPRLERHWFDAWGLRKKGEADPSDAEIHRRLLAYWKERGMAPMMLANSIAELGGLHIVGTERHEARRIDNQLRGRAGRQGDPGSSRFFVSLEDELMRIFMAEWVRRFMLRAGLGNGEPIESGMVSRSIERAQKKVEEHNFEARKHVLEYDEVMDEQRKLIYSQRQEVLEGGGRRDPADTLRRAVRRFLAPGLQPPSRELPPRVVARLRAFAVALGADLTPQEWEATGRSGLADLLVAKAKGPLANGFAPQLVRAWAERVVDDCRAAAAGRARAGLAAWPELWDLPRTVRWAEGLGAACTLATISGIVRDRIAGVVARAAGQQHADADRDEFLHRWFVLGYEQDPLLFGDTLRWEIKTFHEWLDAMGVGEAAGHSRVAGTSPDELRKRWLDAAGKTFGGQAAGDAAADLARRAARLYLGSPAFLRRPDAERVAVWAERRLGVRVGPRDIEATFDAVADALVAALAKLLGERLGKLPPAEAQSLWAKNAAAWHLDMHLAFPGHDVAGLADFLGTRFRASLDPFELAKKPPDEMAELIRREAAARGDAAPHGERLEGLEDIVLQMIDGAVARVIEQNLGGAAPAERCFASMAQWAHDLRLGVTEAQWRACDAQELCLHFTRAAAEAYPADEPQQLVETLVPRFLHKCLDLFLGSESFRAQPSHGGLATWTVARFPSLGNEGKLEGQLRRFAENKLKDTRDHLLQTKLDDYQQRGTSAEEAIRELVPPTLEAYLALNEDEELPLPGLAAFARKVFAVNVSLEKFEEEAEGEPRAGVRVLTELARARYERRAVGDVARDALEGVFALCVPPEQFPAQWQCEAMDTWLRGAGLALSASAEDIRAETLAAIESHIEQAVAAAYAERPVEQARAEVVRIALGVFLETDLAEEGRNLIGLANAVNRKFGVPLEPFELSKHRPEDFQRLGAHLRDRVLETYEARKRELGSQRMLWTIRQLLLQTIDVKWKQHLYNMDLLRGTIGFRGYGQQDPKVEYKREGYKMFDLMTKSIEDTVTDYLLKVKYERDEEEARSIWQADRYIHEEAASYREQHEQQQRAAEAPAARSGKPVVRAIVSGREPGRNDPCPCGKTKADGKPVKYKNCCGRRHVG